MIFFSPCGCRCDCLCGGVGVALTVKAVEGRNISNVCALKQSQKPYFMFYYVLLLFLYFFYLYTYVCYVELFVFFIVEFE